MPRYTSPSNTLPNKTEYCSYCCQLLAPHVATDRYTTVICSAHLLSPTRQLLQCRQAGVVTTSSLTTSTWLHPPHSCPSQQGPAAPRSHVVKVAHPPVPPSFQAQHRRHRGHGVSIPAQGEHQQTSLTPRPLARLPCRLRRVVTTASSPLQHSSSLVCLSTHTTTTAWPWLSAWQRVGMSR
jgi:hypothetical protein